MVDGSSKLDENDEKIIDWICGRRAIVLLNKSDLEMQVSEEELKERTGHTVIAVSAKENSGIDRLEQEIEDMFINGEIDFNDEVMITNARHKNALAGTLESLEMVRRSVEEMCIRDSHEPVGDGKFCIHAGLHQAGQL